MKHAASSAGQGGDPRENTIVDGKYQLERLLGAGGMANVYRGKVLSTGEHVAIKILHRSMMYLPDAVRRFEREALAASSINDVNVARALDHGRLADGSFFIVFEHAPGTRLDCIVAEQRGLPEARALLITRQIASALVASHALGIIHRDLKPDNVMLARGPNGEESVKVLDFGIAKLTNAGDQLTAVGAVFGTPDYMSPEQTQGKTVDARSDLYALGIVLYEMLNGESPFAGPDPITVLRRQLSELPKPLGAAVSPRVKSLIERLLAKDPAQRPQSALDVVAEIDDIIAAQSATSLGGIAHWAGAPVESAPPAALSMRAEPAQLRAKPFRAPIFIASGVLLAALSFGMWRGILAEREALASERDVWAAERAEAAAAKAPRVESPPAPAAPVAPVATPVAPEPAPPPAVDEQADARVKLERLDKIPVYKREASDWSEIARAHTLLENHKAAVSAYSNLLSLRDRKDGHVLPSDLERALRDPQASAAAMQLCTSPKMGSLGLDILFATWKEVRREPATLELGRQIWRQLLISQHRASPALRVAMELERSRRCETVEALLPQAIRSADERSLERLTEISGRTNCADDDCYLCLAGSRKLSAAIDKAERRAPPDLSALVRKN